MDQVVEQTQGENRGHEYADEPTAGVNQHERAGTAADSSDAIGQWMGHSIPLYLRSAHSPIASARKRNSSGQRFQSTIGGKVSIGTCCPLGKSANRLL